MRILILFVHGIHVAQQERIRELETELKSLHDFVALYQRQTESTLDSLKRQLNNHLGTDVSDLACFVLGFSGLVLPFFANLMFILFCLSLFIHSYFDLNLQNEALEKDKARTSPNISGNNVSSSSHETEDRALSRPTIVHGNAYIGDMGHGEQWTGE